MQESATNVTSNFQSWLSEFYPELLDDYYLAGRLNQTWDTRHEPHLSASEELRRSNEELRRRDERHKRLVSAFEVFYQECPWGEEFNGEVDNRCFSGAHPWWDRDGFCWRDREEGADIRESSIPFNELSYYFDINFNTYDSTLEEIQFPCMEHFEGFIEGRMEGFIEELIRELYFSNGSRRGLKWLNSSPFEIYDDEMFDSDGNLTFPYEWEFEKTVIMFTRDFCRIDYHDLFGTPID